MSNFGSRDVHFYGPQKRKFKKQPQAKKNAVVTHKQLNKRLKAIEHQEELKYKDFMNTDTFVTPQVLGTCSIAQGDDFNQRVGEEIVVKKLDVMFRANKTVGSTISNSYRIMIVRDRQANGIGAFAVTSGGTGANNDAILDNNTITDTLHCPINYRCKDRYKVYTEELIVMNPDSSAVNMQAFWKHTVHFPKGLRIKYSDSGATVASITSNQLVVLCLANAIADIPAVEISTRLWFTDA